MKLQKAIKPIITYPKRKHIKPIILSATVAMALTACSPQIAGKMPNENPEANCSSVYAPSNPNQEVKYPENIAGGMPIFIPEENSESNNSKK